MEYLTCDQQSQKLNYCWLKRATLSENFNCESGDIVSSAASLVMFMRGFIRFLPMTV